MVSLVYPLFIGRQAFLPLTQYRVQEETKAIRLNSGVSYPLSDWLTFSTCAKPFKVKNGETVLDRIARDIIATENVKEIRKLGLRFVKAVPYTPRPYGQKA